MKRRVIFAAVAAMVVAVVPAAWAQVFSQTQKGDGTISRERSKDERVEQVRVNLQLDGKVRVVLSGPGSQHTYDGTWTKGSANQLNLSLSADGNDDRGTVSGTLYLTSDQRSFERLDLSGTAAGRSTTLRFTAGDGKRSTPFGVGNAKNKNNGGNTRVPTTIDSTQSGTGQVRVPDHNAFRVNQAQVTVRPDDSVRVVLSGDTTLTFTGRVTRRTGDEIFVHLDGNVLGTPATLEGAINVRRKSSGFDRLLLSSLDNPALDIKFTAR